MLKNFEVEYSSILMIGRDALDEREIDIFARNSGQTHGDATVQTEIEAAISKNLDVVILHKQPYPLQKSKPEVCEQGQQTEISGEVVDFCAHGSQKYE